MELPERQTEDTQKDEVLVYMPYVTLQRHTCTGAWMHSHTSGQTVPADELLWETQRENLCLESSFQQCKIIMFNIQM